MTIPDILPFPLYHGTSTVWRDSILKIGLGGWRPIEQLRAREFCRDAVGYIESVRGDICPEVDFLMWKTMADQRVTATGMNFRHGGGVYLTPSRSTAFRYAGANPFGSELLTECYRMYRAIAATLNGAAPAWFGSYEALVAMFKSPGTPLLVTISGVRVSDLVGEDGGEDMRKLTWLFDQIEEEDQRREQHESLRRDAPAGDEKAIVELFLNGKKEFWAPEKIIEVLGQQTNFQSHVIYPAPQLQLKNIGDSEIERLDLRYVP